MGMCCEKKTLIGWRNVWNMRWRATDQEVDQRGHGKTLCKNIAKHIIWTRRMLRIEVMEEADKYWMMIRMVGGWVFLLVPAHLGSPGQRAVKRLLLLLCMPPQITCASALPGKTGKHENRIFYSNALSVHCQNSTRWFLISSVFLTHNSYSRCCITP